MTPFDAYRQYLALKNHFSKPKYDYHRYAGKSRASIESFNKRKDRYWFEKISRQKTDKELIDFFIANFISVDDPSTLWIGSIIRTGDDCYNQWVKRQQSLKYIFKEQSNELLSNYNLEELFDCSKNHPPILKKFLSSEVSPEVLVIFEKIFSYSKSFDKTLLDPVWETVSLKVKKYSPFLNIDVGEYKTILRTIIGG